MLKVLRNHCINGSTREPVPQDQLNTMCKHAFKSMFSVVSKSLSRPLVARLTGCTTISSEL